MHSNGPALGLAYLDKQTNIITGSRPDAFYEGGERLGAFLCVCEKDFGLSPGFFALLMNEAYHKQARNLLITRLQDNNAFFLERIQLNNTSKVDAITQLLTPEYINTPVYQIFLTDMAIQNSLIPDILADYNKKRILLRAAIAKKLVESQPSFEKVLEDNFFSKLFAINELSNPLPHTAASYQVLLNHPECRQTIIDTFNRESETRVHVEKYIFKHDYRETYFGLVSIPIGNYLLQDKYKLFYNTLKKWTGNKLALTATIWRARFTQAINMKTTHQANFQAIKSCFAADLARTRGLKVPKQYLAKAEYPSGRLKLLTFSEWHDDLQGIIPSTLITKPRKNSKGLIIPESFYTHLNLALGQSYIIHLTLMTILGRDSHFGLEGQRLTGFDRAGKPFPYEHILDTLKNNFECAPFKKILSVYSDTTLTEKMQSLYILNKIRTGNMPAFDILSTLPSGLQNTLNQIVPDHDLLIIDAYTKRFPEHAKYFKKIRANLIALDIEILKRFEKRILLPPNILTLIDNLEKLCSKVSATSCDGKIVFNHLQIDSKNQAHWDAHITNNNIEFSCDQNIQKTIETFFSNLAPLNFEIQLSEMSIRIAASDLDKLLSILTESTVATFHRLKTSSMQTENRLVIQEEDYDRLANLD